MEVGKVSETVLKRSVFKQLKTKRSEVLIGPSIGEDCCVIGLEADEAMVLSTDPITGTTQNLGDLAVHITLNDLAAGGAEPIGLLLTLLLPEGYSEKDLKVLMKEVAERSEEFGVQVIGGHTEVTKAVNQPVISVTGVVKIHKDKVLLASRIQAGHEIVMTKWAGVEGTAILAAAAEEELCQRYNSTLVMRAKEFSKCLSVVKDSKIAMEFPVYAMHDVTEGGIFGALWEIGSKAKMGLEVWQDRIPIRQETVEICEYFDINPYKLIGSGSLLIVTDQARAMVERLQENHIEATIIGRMIEGNHKQIHFDDIIRSVEPAKSDELYKALERMK